MKNEKKCTFCNSTEDLIPHEIGNAPIYVCIHCENVRQWKRIKTEERMASENNPSRPMVEPDTSPDDLLY